MSKKSKLKRAQLGSVSVFGIIGALSQKAFYGGM